MDRDSGDQSDSGHDDDARDMADQWDADDDLTKLAGMTAYERAMLLRDRTDPNEAAW